MCQASKYAALLFVSVLSKAFVLHGTLSCLLITHKLAEIWFYSTVIFFFKLPFNKDKRRKILQGYLKHKFLIHLVVERGV